MLNVSHTAETQDGCNIKMLIQINRNSHYYDVITGTIASQITSLMIFDSTVYSDADQRKHQSSASLAFVRGLHRGPVNPPHNWPVTRKIFPFDDVIMPIGGILSLYCKSHTWRDGHYIEMGPRVLTSLWLQIQHGKICQCIQKARTDYDVGHIFLFGCECLCMMTLSWPCGR